MTCFVGLDVSMEETAYCVRNAEDRIPGQGKTGTDPDVIAAALARFGRPARCRERAWRAASARHHGGRGRHRGRRPAPALPGGPAAPGQYRVSPSRTKARRT